MEPSRKKEEAQSYENLLFILEIILNHLNIIKLNNDGNVENEVKKLKNFRIDTNEKDLKLFAYFLQKLFLDENKKEIDFNRESLENILPKETIVNIFTELKDGIKEHNFFYFLKRIGTLFSTFYLIDQAVQEFLKPNIHQCENMYECVLFILFSCKKKTDGKWILGNYKEYYRFEYENDLLGRIIISTKEHYNLLYCEKSFESSDEEKSEESDEEEGKIEAKEKLEGTSEKEEIISDIRANFFEFFCHVFLFFENELKEFSSIFLNFIIERKNLTSFFELETYSKIRTLNECEKEYLKYIRELFEEVFIDFKKKSIDNFMKDLFEFISDRKKKYNNSFLDFAFKIGDMYKLKENDIAIISMIFFNKNFIDELEDISKKDDYNILEYKEQNNLNDQELVILNYLINRNKNPKENISSEIEKENNVLSNNKNEKESSLEEYSYNNISNRHYSNEEYSKLGGELVNNSIDNRYNASLKDNKINDYSYWTKLLKIELKKSEEKYEEKLKKYEEKLEKNEEELKKTKEEFNKKIEQLSRKIVGLTNIHRKIYFRDVSKYYISIRKKIFKH